MQIYYGDDQALIINKIKVALKAKDQEKIFFQQFNGDTVNLLSNLMQINIFGDELFYVISNCNFLVKLSEQKLYQSLIDELIKINPENLIMVANGAKLLSNAKIKLLLATVKLIPVPALTNRNMKTYIKEELKKQAITLPAELIENINQKLIPNALIIENEINKLSNYEPQQLDADLIDRVIANYADDNIFKLTQYYLNNNFDKLFTLFYQMRLDNYDPINMIAMMAKQIYDLYLIKIGLNQHLSNNTIAQQLGVQPFIINMNKPLLINYDIEKLKEILKKIYLLDINIKSGIIMNDIAIKMFLIEKIGVKHGWK